MLGFAPFGAAPFGGVPAATETVTLTAEAGSYVLTGVSVAPVGRSDAGSYVLSGQAAAFTVRMGAAIGNYPVSGQDALFSGAMSAAAGSYALTGEAALFSLSASCAAGSYSLSGMVITHPVTMLAESGAYTIVGHTAELSQGFFFTFAGEGEGVGEFVGTTGYTMMLEDPDVLLSYAAELRLRSLS